MLYQLSQSPEERYYYLKTPWIELKYPEPQALITPPPAPPVEKATWDTPAMYGIPVIGWMGIAFILGILISK